MLNDLRYALRLLFRSPAFTATAVAALALGIGANTAIFSLVNAVLLRPLPYEAPDRLVVLWGNVKRAAVERRGASYPDYVDWRDRSRSFQSMAAYWDATFTLFGVDEPERIHGEVVSAAYFPLLGVKTRLGRVFRPEDDQTPGNAPTVLIGERFWKRRFGAHPSLLGKPIRLDDRSYTVIGVVPESFRGMSDEAELWVTVMGAIAPADARFLAERGSRWLPALARLRPGVTQQQAQADLDSISQQLEQAYPATNEKRGVEVASLSSEVVGDIRPALLVILAAVGFVLLIACANVANLLLSRAEARSKEMAIRAALGAGRTRILRQLTVESLTLTLLGGGLGVLVSLWGSEALMAASPIRFPSFTTVRLDWTVIGFTVLISVGTGLALGLAPALISSIAGMQQSLKDTAGRSSGGLGRQRFRSALVVAEVALALVLLAGAGLFMRSFRQLTTLDPGFRPEGLLTLRVSLPRLASPPSSPGGATPAGSATAPVAPDAQAASAALRIRETLRALPSVQDVSLGSDLPLSGEGGAIFYTAEGQPPVNAQNMPRGYTHRVTPGFFRALGVRLLHGRDFTEAELDGRSQAVIVSEGVVKRFWPGQDPIGKRIKGGGPNSNSPWLQIVGVVSDVNYRSLPRNPTPDPDLYFPFNERGRQFAVFVRTGVAPLSLAAAVREAIRDLDKSAVIYNVAAMTERVGRQTARSRFISWLMGIFAATALLLAMIGIYGVMAYAVTRRTQEIGIRMALGASSRDVMGMIVRRGLLLAAVGIVIGLAAALVLTRFVRTLLFGVSPTDPLVFAGVSVLLILVAMLAAYLPARRATRIDPMRALRYE